MAPEHSLNAERYAMSCLVYIHLATVPGTGYTVI